MVFRWSVVSAAVVSAAVVSAAVVSAAVVSAAVVSAAVWLNLFPGNSVSCYKINCSPLITPTEWLHSWYCAI